MSKGIDNFVPERLLQILSARRLTQAQLSDLVGVSPATISKWKSGLQSPEREALIRLATIVNVSPEWFTRNESLPCTSPLYRSNAAAHARGRDKLYTRLGWGQEIGVGIDQFVDFPELKLPDYEFSTPFEISDEEIEVAASTCRKLWNLGRGPISDLALAVEGAGVILIREETEVPNIEGLSSWSTQLNRPFIYLSSDKANAYRSRFDLAHEVGHLVLHKQIPPTKDDEQYKLMEKQAHQFAAALLLPAETFSGEIRLPVSLDSLLLLKQRWGVSVGAMIMRLHVLDVIDDDTKANLFKRRSARWGGKSEPNDKDREPEQPRLLKRSIELMINSGVMPLEGVVKYFGLSEKDIEQLAGLELGFLSGKSNNVVELARLKSFSASSANDHGTASIVNLSEYKKNTV